MLIAHSKLKSGLWVPVTAGSSGADDFCWDLYLQVRSSHTSMTNSWVTERPVPEGNLGPHCLSLFFLFFFYFLVFYLDYF